MRLIGRNRNINTPLSMDELQTLAPSAFAGQPWSEVSSKYTFISTIEVIEGMREAGFVPFSAQQGKSRIPGKENFTKHMIRFRSLNQEIHSVGDTLLEAVMLNAHDRTSRYKIMGGAFKCACLNGLLVAESMFASVNVRHSGNVIQQVVEGTQMFFEQAPKVLEAIRVWRSIELLPSEQLLLADSARTLRYADNEGAVNTPVTPEMLLTARRYDDNSNDLWNTFNRIQENTTKGFRTRQYSQGRRIGSRAINSIDGDVKLNRALWSLAEGMAKLKGEK